MSNNTVGSDYRRFSSQIYKEALENCANYNAHVRIDRRSRLPFIDSQTGVAQNKCSLWMKPRHRMPGDSDGQIYTYPSNRWRKRTRHVLIHDEVIPTNINTADFETTLHKEGIVSDDNVLALVDETIQPDMDKEASLLSEYNRVQYGFFSFRQDLEDADFDDDSVGGGDDDDDDYEINPRRKKNKKSAGGGGGGGGGTRRKKTEMNEEEDKEKDKPFSCDVCGKRYKNKPGLLYHYSHYHEATEKITEQQFEEKPLAHPSPQTSISSGSGDSKSEEDSKAGLPPGVYCDFCLGDAADNKKTGMAEQLISCSDCGRSGHPSCLQFTVLMISRVKSYQWQCIECKSCTLCGTSDNDDQLLFCDDCDRGYHMYCLNPPMDSPPEGLWSCHVCLEADKAAAAL